MRVLAATEGGTAVLVSATDEIYDGPGDLTIDVVRPGEPNRRWIGRRTLLVDSAVTDGGGADLLVRDHGRDDRPVSLSLLRVERNGSVRRLWRVVEAGGQAALARSGSWTAIAWLADAGLSDRPPVLRLATVRGSRIRTHRVAGVLPAWLGRSDPLYLADLDIAVDPDGRVTFAMTVGGRPRSVLVLASTERDGRVLQRQPAPRVEGLVSLHVAPGGRTAVVAEDTGIEGEVGECVRDHEPRMIRVAVREPAAERFQPTRMLDQLDLACGASGARLVSGPAGRLAVLWGAAPEGTPPSATRVRIALAVPGELFGRRVGPRRGARLQGAVFDSIGDLHVFGTQLEAGVEPFAGPLVVQRRRPDGSVQPAEVLDRAGGEGGVLAAHGPGGTLVAAWTRADGSRQLAVAP